MPDIAVEEGGPCRHDGCRGVRDQNLALPPAAGGRNGGVVEDAISLIFGGWGD